MNERHVILTAAIRAFAEEGLEKPTLATIARRAELETGAVRALFIDKAALLEALLEEATGPLVSGISLAVANMKIPREIVLESLRIYDQWLLDNPNIVRMMMRCIIDDPAALQSMYQKWLLPSEFYEQLQRLIDNDQLRCKDLFTLSMLFDSLILMPHMIRSSLALMNPEQSPEQVIENHFEAMVDLFENGLFVD